MIEHLLAAGRPGQAEAVAADLRWTGARLQASGPAGPYADLALIGTPTAQRLGRVLGQAAHLLAPTDSPRSVIDILYSRVSHDPGWAAQAQALTSNRKPPRLINKWPLPDLPGPALRRTLTGHVEPVEAVVIAPDGTWLATGGRRGSVRIWDPATGQQRATLTKYANPVSAMAIAPDGTWLAIGRSYTRSGVQIWDPVTDMERAAFTGHASSVTAVAIAPDGTWLATGDADGAVRIWGLATGQQRAALTGHAGPLRAVAIAPDGTWLASVGADGAVRCWALATGQQRAAFTVHAGSVTAVAIAPDGSWLASVGADEDGAVRIWDPAAGQQRAALTGHAGPLRAVAIAPDGTWLATGDYDGRCGSGTRPPVASALSCESTACSRIAPGAHPLSHSPPQAAQACTTSHSSPRHARGAGGDASQATDSGDRPAPLSVPRTSRSPRRRRGAAAPRGRTWQRHEAFS